MWILNTLPFRGSVRLFTNLSFFWILNTLPFQGARDTAPNVFATYQGLSY